MNVVRDAKALGMMGIELWKHPQSYRRETKLGTGLWMESSIDSAISLLSNQRMSVSDSPVLSWNMWNVDVKANENKYRRLVKKTQGDKDYIAKIDGIVTLCMCCGIMEAYKAGKLEQVHTIKSPWDHWSSY